MDQQNMTQEEQTNCPRKMVIKLITGKLHRLPIEDLRVIYLVVCDTLDKRKAQNKG
jgi:hypothetical protein